MMKRGFLNSSKAMQRQPGPQPNPAPNSSVTESETKTNVDRPPIGIIAVPEGYETKFSSEHDPRAGSAQDTLMITTVPHNAKADEPTTECLFLYGSKEVLMNIPGFPEPVKYPTQPAFYMKPSPGKGNGLFSKRALKMGDLILSERPLLVTTPVISTDEPTGLTHEQHVQLSLNRMEKIYTLCVDRMSSESKEAFMGLANSHTQDGSGPVTGIVRTNGLGIKGLRPGATDLTRFCGAIGKNISRVNHSCSPNTKPHFDIPSFSFRLFAVRDIAKSEELTLCYTDILRPAAERNSYLKPYGFVCTCAACKAATTSDARRTAIAAFDPSAEARKTLTNHEGLIEKCRAQMALIEDEGLESLDAYRDAATTLLEAYNRKGDKLGAQMLKEKTESILRARAA
ncbi:hypothetical protein C8J57DRAFT_1395150 [Mycena rebaudengoi]|nr:hypothetical protein C8J57DRAFT_1395150 [Mycena rebaudengoi]